MRTLAYPRQVKATTITSGRAAELAGMPRPWIDEQFDAGRIRGFRIRNGYRRIDPAHFREYLIRIKAPQSSIDALAPYLESRMTTRGPFDIAADCVALSTMYSEACAAHAAAQARHEIEPEVAYFRDKAGDSKIAMDNVHRRLLDACNELRDAGAGVVAANIYQTADRNATLAQDLAFKAELSSLKGAA